MSSSDALNKRIEILVRSLVFLGALALGIYIAFFTKGYYAGAMRGILIFSIFVSGFMFIRVDYPKARLTLGPGPATMLALKQLFFFWVQYKDPKPKRPNRK